MQTQRLPLLLASTSPYRRELLKKLGLPFAVQAPSFDEETVKSQSMEPQALAEFLAQSKALSLNVQNNVVIGGDQLVAFAGQILGKPKTMERAKIYEDLQLLTATRIG